MFNSVEKYFSRHWEDIQNKKYQKDPEYLKGLLEQRRDPDKIQCLNSTPIIQFKA